MVFPAYLAQQQGFYRYDPLTLSTGGPSRLFPFIGEDGVLRYMLKQLRQRLLDQGQVSEPVSLVLAQVESSLTELEQRWDEVSVLLADLQFFQSGWVNFALPPNEQFSSAYIRDLRSMGQIKIAAERATQIEVPDWSHFLPSWMTATTIATAQKPAIEQQRSRFYQTLEQRGRRRPKVSLIYERDQGLSDREFARQRLAGANPMVIHRLQEADRSLLSTWASDQPYLLTNGETLQLTQAAAENRLFLLDYPLLKDLTASDLQIGKYVGSPQALFYRSEQGLLPVLIQLERGHKVFTPAESDEWMRAKLYVQVADATHHELISHLCYTHLAMETFAIATARQLPKNHPLAQLLAPHFKFLLAINHRGNRVLLAEGAAIDSLLAPTGVASLDLIDRAYRDRPLEHYALPHDLKHRGLEPEYLSDFPYRDDAQLLWDAIAGYVSAYLLRYYLDDRAVMQDAYLQAWAAELGSPMDSRPLSEFPQLPDWVPPEVAKQTGLQPESMPAHSRVPGFPTSQSGIGEIQTLQQLIDLTTLTIFTCGPQHAAVNFSQFDYLGYVPNAPMAAYAKPDVATVSTLMPPPQAQLNQMELTFALSGVIWGRLGDAQLIQFADAGDRQILQQFQDRLTQVEQEIQQRNCQRRDRDGVDYPYLLPSQIPNSINI